MFTLKTGFRVKYSLLSTYCALVTLWGHRQLILLLGVLIELSDVGHTVPFYR